MPQIYFAHAKRSSFAFGVIPQASDLMIYWTRAFRPSMCLNHEEFSLEFYLLKYKALDNLSFKNPSSWPRLSISTQSTFIRFTGTSNQKELGWKAYKNLFFLIQVALSQPIWKPYVLLFYQCITEKVPNYISHGAAAESTLFCSLPQNHNLQLKWEDARVVVSLPPWWICSDLRAAGYMFVLVTS